MNCHQFLTGKLFECIGHVDPLLKPLPQLQQQRAGVRGAPLQVAAAVDYQFRARAEQVEGDSLLFYSTNLQLR